MGLSAVIYSKETTYFGFYRIIGLAHIGSVNGYCDHLLYYNPDPSLYKWSRETTYLARPRVVLSIAFKQWMEAKGDLEQMIAEGRGKLEWERKIPDEKLVELKELLDSKDFKANLSRVGLQ